MPHGDANVVVEAAKVPHPAAYEYSNSRAASVRSSTDFSASGLSGLVSSDKSGFVHRATHVSPRSALRISVGRAPELAARRSCQRDAGVAVIEVVVEQPQIAAGRDAALPAVARRRRRSTTSKPQPASNRRSASIASGSLSTSSTRKPVRPPRRCAACRRAVARRARTPRGTRTANTVPAPRRAAQRQRRAEQLRDAVGDRQAQPQPLPRRVVAAAEFFEDRRLLVVRAMPGPVSCTSMRRRVAVAPHAEQHAAARRVAHRVGEEVLQHAAQQLRVAVRSTRAWRRSGSAGRARRRARGIPRPAAPARRPAGTRAAAAPARRLPAATCRAGRSAGRWSNPARRRSAPRVSRCGVSCSCWRQRIGEQMRGVQRLHQVVADRGEEAALGLVGAFGFALGDLKVGRAFDHALLQRFVGLISAGFGATERGDVGEGGDEAAAGHRDCRGFRRCCRRAARARTGAACRRA